MQWETQCPEFTLLYPRELFNAFWLFNGCPAKISSWFQLWNLFRMCSSSDYQHVCLCLKIKSNQINIHYRPSLFSKNIHKLFRQVINFTYDWDEFPLYIYIYICSEFNSSIFAHHSLPQSIIPFLETWSKSVNHLVFSK